MDPATIGGIVSGIGSIAGGLFGKKKGPSVEDQVAAQGLQINRWWESQMENAAKWGVHPTVALGINPAQGGISFDAGGDNPIGAAVADLGQNLGSAIERRQSPEQKVTAQVMSRQMVERGELENELLKTQIAQARATLAPSISSSNSSEMIAGQADSGVDYLANQLVKHENSSGKEAGDPSSWTKVKTRMGDMIVPSKDFQDRAEDIPFIGYEWVLRNKLPEMIDSIKAIMPKKSRYSKIDWNRVRSYNR